MMANSFSLLLSYVDNLLWLCTQVFHGIVFIFEINYWFVTTIITYCVQLWTTFTQALIDLGHAFVWIIEFIAELPVRSVHLTQYLIRLGKSVIIDVSKECICWCYTQCIHIITVICQKLGTAVISASTQVVDFVVFHFNQLTNLSNSIMNSTVGFVSKFRTDIVYAFYTMGITISSSVVDFVNVLIGLIQQGFTYPIQLVNTCTEEVVKTVHYMGCFIKTFNELLGKVLEEVINIAIASSTAIASGLYEILNALKEIMSYPLKMIFYLCKMLAEFLATLAGSLLSIATFIGNNWGALLALSLCIILVWLTINMAGQHQRNIQTIVQDLTRLVNNLTHSRRQAVNRMPARPEGHLDHDLDHDLEHDIQAEAQQVDDPPLEENVNNNAQRNALLAEGNEEQPGPSQGRHTPHISYSLRSRPLTPSSEANGSAESIMSELKHRLTEEQERKMCVVCLDAFKDTLLLPCRHLCVCLPCADRIVSSDHIQNRQCPLCRTRIGSIVEVYS